MSKYCFKIEATEENTLKRIQNSVENLKDQIILMSLKHEQTNEIFRLVQNVIDTYSDAIQKIVPQSDKKISDRIREFHQCSKDILAENDSIFKRKKEIEKNQYFVPPEEKSIGFKWTQTLDPSTGKIIRKYQQNTSQFIRPSVIIKKLFLNADFVDMYMSYAANKSHECEENVYKDFCCGSLYRQNVLFFNNPNALKLQLYTDDFEPCDALKSKAGKHKLCAFYLTIRNMPRKLQSQLSNIFLIALVDSVDLKSESASFDNIIEVILDDLKQLEMTGVEIGNGETIKAFLFNMCFDNLGENVCYGLPQGFQANYFCRFCMCHKSECKILTEEDPEKLRDIASYDTVCARILEDEDLDLTKTKGIQRYCKLNDLKSFHIFSNYTVDPMHDLLEGAVPFTLHVVFEHCIEKKLFNLPQLRNIPSKLRIDSKNLGQNATQLYCLMKHIPFILKQYENDLKGIWTLVQSLLQILEMVFSTDINNSDLNRLELEIECHTKFIVNVIKKDLIPKHHLLLHYPRVIRTMGPTAFTSAMRLEAKHQELKAIAQKTNNFVDLNKTIAEKHQISMCLKGNKYCDDVEPGQIMAKFIESDEFDNYKSCAGLILKGDELIIKSLRVNNIVFKPGLILLHESCFYEISHILHSSENYSFLCETFFDVKNRDSFCNSLIIEENLNLFHVLNISQMKNTKCYQKSFVGDKIHVICDTLELSKIFPI